MGTYDTVHVYEACPYCGHMKHRFQTKDLGKMMGHYQSLLVFPNRGRELRDGDIPLQEFDVRTSEHVVMRATEIMFRRDSIRVIEGCTSFLCQWWAHRRDIKRGGYMSGLGRTYGGTLPIRDVDGKRVIVGLLQNVELDDLTEDSLHGWEDNMREADYDMYSRALDRLSYPPLALLYMRRFGRPTHDE